MITLRDLRERAGLTRDELAARLRLNVAAVDALDVQRIDRASVATLCLYASACDASVEVTFRDGRREAL